MDLQDLVKVLLEEMQSQEIGSVPLVPPNGKYPTQGVFLEACKQLFGGNLEFSEYRRFRINKSEEVAFIDIREKEKKKRIGSAVFNYYDDPNKKIEVLDAYFLHGAKKYLK